MLLQIFSYVQDFSEYAFRELLPMSPEPSHLENHDCERVQRKWLEHNKSLAYIPEKTWVVLHFIKYACLQIPTFV